jgi:hypothetical protein
MQPVRARERQEVFQRDNWQRRWQRFPQFRVRTAGNPGGVVQQTPAEMNYNAALDAAVKASDASGTPHTAIGAELTHGYTLPPGKYAGLRDLLDGLYDFSGYVSPRCKHRLYILEFQT